MKIEWLKGNYVGDHERQRQAKEAACSVVVEFHMNSAARESATGGEVWRKPNSTGSKAFAKAAIAAYERAGLPLRSQPIDIAVAGTRASWIRFYSMPTILLEPLFISNLAQANWIHNVKNVRKLGEALAEAFGLILKTYSNPVVVGISIGHRYKTMEPNDNGAACILGDTEADHAERLAKVVAAALKG